MGSIELENRQPSQPANTDESVMPPGGSDTVYRYLIDGVTEYAIFAVSTTGEVLSWNAGAERSFGYVKQEIVGKNYDVFFTADDRAQGDPAGELVMAAADGRADNDRWHVRKDGSKFWATNTVQPLRNNAGDVTAFTKIVRDTTGQYEAAIALRQSEERLRLLVESVTDYAIFSTSPDGSITLWNAGAEHVFGYDAAEILGTHYAHLFTNEDVTLGVPQHNLSEAIVSGSCSDERWLVRKDGVHFYARAVLTTIKGDSSDEPHGFVNVTQDITSRKQVEEDEKLAGAEIASARDEAVHMAKLKSQFVATMSHEIRTPISGVIGMTELLMLTTLTDEQREYANVVHDSGESLLRVINDILTYSKLEAGKVELESVEFELANLITSVIDLMRKQFCQKDITLTLRVDPHLPSRLVGDPGRLRQVLTNLVGNALKFTPPRGHVRIDAVEIGSDGAQVNVRFAIRDSGIGIAADVQQQLFQPFKQGDGSTTRKFGGTGLGLSICKQLVTLMGGTIGVESTLSQGATFWFSLSLRKCSTPVGVANSPVFKGNERMNVRSRSEKVLLAEDNDVNRLVAQRQFEKLGFGLTSVTNGREAVKAVQSEEYDLVFMDCNMPEMDGFEATKEIRMFEATTTKRLPIVAMTADAQIEDRNACLAAGMDDYISKPATLANLRTVLARWLPRATYEAAPEMSANSK